jgi:hypothetical protein
MRESNGPRERETSGKEKTQTKEKAENCRINSVLPPPLHLIRSSMCATAD